MLWKLFGRTHGQGKHYIPPTSLKRGYNKYPSFQLLLYFAWPRASPCGTWNGVLQFACADTLKIALLS